MLVPIGFNCFSFHFQLPTKITITLPTETEARDVAGNEEIRADCSVQIQVGDLILVKVRSFSSQRLGQRHTAVALPARYFVRVEQVQGHFALDER